LKAIALPKLYHTVQLKVPLKWNRLASLEKLLATSPEGLCHTRRLWILGQQAPIKDDRYGNRDDLDLTDSEGDEVDSRAEADDESFRLYAPDMEASCALNALVRLLVLKTARQQLREFLYVDL